MDNEICEASAVRSDEIRVALYCDQPVLIAGFQALIAAEPNLRLSCACGILTDYFAHLEQSRPEIALVDAPPQLNPSSILEISRHAPTSRIVLWVHSVNVQLAHELKEAGIAGILRKQLSGELIIRCLTKVAAGELWFERELMSSMLGARPVRLSPREQQLVALVSQGLSNKQIASALVISEGTVKVYFSRLFRKLGVSDRFELALFGLQNRRLDEMPSDLPRFRSIVVHHSVVRQQQVA